jgi:hypothetical protein
MTENEYQIAQNHAHLSAALACLNLIMPDGTIIEQTELYKIKSHLLQWSHQINDHLELTEDD